MRSLGRDLRRRVDLVVTDLDGTVLDEDRGRATPPELWAALAEFQAVGGRWWVATGRDLPDALEAISRAGSRGLPSVVVATEQLIFRRRGDSFVGCAGWNDPCRRVLARLFADNAAAVDAMRIHLDTDHCGCRYEDPLSPLCVEARSVAELARIRVALAPWVASMAGAAFAQNDRYGRVTHRDFHKGSAVAHVQARASLRAERTVAVGNDLNDLPMLDSRVAAVTAAPGDAARAVLDAVARQGGVVGREPGPRGVLDALRAIGRGRDAIPRARG